jgi:trk system potassium uptake protein
MSISLHLRLPSITKIIGVVLMLFSLSMWPPIVVALVYGETHMLGVFAATFLATFGVGYVCWLVCRRDTLSLRVRDGCLAAVLFWVVLCIFGAVPFYFDGNLHMSLINAMFESVSGLTTTGATVLTGLDGLSKTILYYRQQLQLLGGMGIIVLAVAVLPALGAGGMQLYQAEVPGPVKDAKMTPRIAETAKILWRLYLGMVVLCAVCYGCAGMDVFEAIGEAFSTVATGGFSMHDQSFGFYNSPMVNVIASVFMVLSAINFSLHYMALSRLDIGMYWHDVELRAFVMMLCVAVVIAFVVLSGSPGFDRHLDKIVFTVISMATTTGLTAVSFSGWPSFLPMFMLVLALVGGCAASTSGGIKVVRLLLLQKQGVRELRRLIHPQGVFVVKLGHRQLSERVVHSIWGFLAVFFTLYIVLILLLLATGLDFNTAFGATTSTLSNLGASIGHVSQHYADLPATSKVVLMFSMLAGRLEVFTLLVLFMPSFWRN